MRRIAPEPLICESIVARCQTSERDGQSEPRPRRPGGRGVRRCRRPIRALHHGRRARARPEDPTGDRRSRTTCSRPRSSRCRRRQRARRSRGRRSRWRAPARRRRRAARGRRRGGARWPLVVLGAGGAWHQGRFGGVASRLSRQAVGRARPRTGEGSRPSGRLRGGIRSVIVPSAISAANATVSDSVGCGWIVSAMSSASAPISSACTVSAISSPALTPTMPGAEQPPRARLEEQLGQPSSRPSDSARPDAAHGNTAFSYSIAVRPCASVSVSPIQATSGSV